jgi:Ni/Co efflux regulator RcnB
MLRRIAFVSIIAIALPTLAMAQGGPPEHRARHPGPARPAVRPHGPPGHMMGPHGAMRPGPGVARGPMLFHGHPLHRVRFAHPWVYPPGWGYRRWAIGAVLPTLFLAPAYYYSGWASVGLTPPPPGYQWVEYGPDLLLVNVTTGQVIDAAYGVFY